MLIGWIFRTTIGLKIQNKKVDVFSNTNFDDKKKNSNLDFEDLIKVDKKKIESAFNIKIDENTIKNTTTNYMNEISSSITADTSSAKKMFDDNLKSITKSLISNYVKNPKETYSNPLMPSMTIPVIYENDVDSIVSDYMKKNETKSILSDMEKKYIIPSSIYENTYTSLISGLLKGYIATYNQMDTTYTKDKSNEGAIISDAMTDKMLEEFMKQAVIVSASDAMAEKMTEALMQKEILTKVGELTTNLMSSLANSFNVNPNTLAEAFKFDLSEDELKRIMNAMTSSNTPRTLKSNLIKLGYQDKDEPTSIAFYFKSFDSKERFIDFIDNYNDKMEKMNEKDKTLNYTDATGILMSSVKKVVNSVSYVLIAFVSISLVVSSIMIGIITYISVLERTKEIGILRAIGASKRNVSSIFNAETFIIGLLSGLMGIGITLIFIPIINYIIHSLTDNVNISATISVVSSITLIILSVILTLIGGLIPSRKASKQDPVVALRTE